MKYSYFYGCQVPSRLTYCDLAVRNVSHALGIELVDLQDAGCCGYPIRFLSSEANFLLSARILALAEKQNMELMMLCNSCYSTILKVQKILQEDKENFYKVNTILKKEGLSYEGKIIIKDILEVLYSDYGYKNIQSKIKKKFENLKVAVHYGCHILRPSKIIHFDVAENPVILDKLVEITSAKSIYWPLKLWCCGCPTLPFDENLALSLARRKIRDAKDSGADCIVTTCPSCQITFDLMQPTIERMYGEKYNLPVLYYPQLLGLAMGIDIKDVGLNLNRIPIDSILNLF